MGWANCEPFVRHYDGRAALDVARRGRLEICTCRRAVPAAAPVIIIIFVVVVARFLFKIVFYAPPLKSAPPPPYRDTGSCCLQRIIRVGFRALFENFVKFSAVMPEDRIS